MSDDWSGHLAARRPTLAEQTAARLERAGFTWDDPAVVRIADHNREIMLRAELAALKADRPPLSSACLWPSCPVHHASRISQYLR